jgi:cytochrome P450
VARILPRLRRNPARVFEELARTYGDQATLRLPLLTIVLVNDPALIERVLVVDHAHFHKGRALEVAKRVLGNGLLTSEGEYHRRHRRLLQPAFHRQRIASYADAMVQHAAVTAAAWRDGATVDMAAEMMRLTLAIVGDTLFGSDVERDASEVGAVLRRLMKLFDLLTLPFADFLDRLPIGPSRTWRTSRQQLDAIIARVIAERRQSGDRGDLLSMLLSARDEEGGLSDDEVRDEALTLFLAGHETTANALTWTWYLLAQHPDVDARLQAEIERVLGDRLPTFDDVSRLPYTRMVIAEAMRLFPPAWAVGRLALHDYHLGEYRLPAGVVVLMSQWVTHRDPRFWPDPLRFDPMRFGPDAGATRPKFSYFPFGGGPRLCIGESFAWTEATLVLATLAQRWTARLVPGDTVDLWPAVTLRPRHGLRLTLHHRTAAGRVQAIGAAESNRFEYPPSQ